MCTDWTPRERVHLLYLVAGNAAFHNADVLLAQLRARIVAQELDLEDAIQEQH
jgi:hypothetical protein